MDKSCRLSRRRAGSKRKISGLVLKKKGSFFISPKYCYKQMHARSVVDSRIMYEELSTDTHTREKYNWIQNSSLTGNRSLN